MDHSGPLNSFKKGAACTRETKQVIRRLELSAPESEWGWRLSDQSFNQHAYSEIPDTQNNYEMRKLRRFLIDEYIDIPKVWYSPSSEGLRLPYSDPSRSLCISSSGCLYPLQKMVIVRYNAFSEFCESLWNIK